MRKVSVLLIFVLGVFFVSGVSALTWRSGGVDRMVLDSNGNLNLTTGNLTLYKGNLTVANNITTGAYFVGSGLFLTDVVASTLKNNTWIGYYETIGGNLTVVGDLNVTGKAYLGDVVVDSDNITVNTLVPKDGDNVSVNGSFVVNKTGFFGALGKLTQLISAIFGSQITFEKTLNSSNGKINISSNGDIYAANNVTVDMNLAITNNASVGKNFAVGQDLAVTRNASVGSNLAVTNNASVGANLAVSNNLAVTHNVSVGSNGKIYYENGEMIIEY